MLQVAVFVDAGYLYAQGAKLLNDKPQPRSSAHLDVKKALEEIKELAQEICSTGRLLRIYWYDGVPKSGLPSSDQNLIANAELVKLRLGTVNSRGEQKGVDSLIVTDLIDLARNRAVTDALVLSGDEDIRVGVQIAQTFGVQVHLLGIAPSRGSQSLNLIHEADTHHEWDRDIVKKFLSVAQAPYDSDEPGRAMRPGITKTDMSLEDAIDAGIATALSKLKNSDPSQLSKYMEILRLGQIPQELDRPTLAIIRNRVGRDLNGEERKDYRIKFSKKIMRIIAGTE